MEEDSESERALSEGLSFLVLSLPGAGTRTPRATRVPDSSGSRTRAQAAEVTAAGCSSGLTRRCACAEEAPPTHSRVRPLRFRPLRPRPFRGARSGGAGRGGASGRGSVTWVNTRTWSGDGARRLARCCARAARGLRGPRRQEGRRAGGRGGPAEPRFPQSVHAVLRGEHGGRLSCRALPRGRKKPVTGGRGALRAA